MTTLPKPTPPDSGNQNRRKSARYRGYPSFLRYDWELSFTAGVLAAAYFLAAYGGLFLFVGITVASLIIAYVIFDRSRREYLVGERRVEMVYGLVSKSSREVRIEDIRAINVRKSGLKGLLGIGDVEFASSGSEGVEVVFADVRSPHRIKKLVRAIQDDLDRSQ